MASLAASLLLAVPDARAGSYSGPSYSGGTYTNIGPGNTPLPDGFNSSTGLYGSVLTPGYYIGGSSGQITAKFTWQPAYPGDPPPASVIVYQHAVAQFSFQAFTKQTASCSDGLGDTEQDSTAGPPSPAIYSGISNGMYYTVQAPDASGNVILQCSPSASFNWSAPGVFPGGASVGYAAAVYPITINPFGATSDGSGGWVIMIGEHFTPELVGIPAALANNVIYSWTVSGTTLQSWTVSSDSKTTTEVDGPGALNVEQPGWYWNDLKNKDETVTCTATVTPPPGQGSPFTVTASQLVSVYVPIWTGTGTGGYVKVNNYPTSTNSSQYYIFTGPTLDMVLDGNPEGMSFNATVKSPVPNLISAGSLQLAQLVTPREATTTFNGYNTEVNFFPQYGEGGLDGAYPYGWIKESNPPGPFTYFTGDTPYIQLLDKITYAATLKHDFQDFLMFLAPGSQQPVPVAHFIWSDDGNAQIPSTGFWKDYASQHGGSDSVGTVTPSGNDATFLPSNVFPMWTQID